jgi:Bacterial low temperature requirement A protein (LtrA)
MPSSAISALSAPPGGHASRARIAGSGSRALIVPGVSKPTVAVPPRRIIRPDDAEARVSPLELFFDLVFVFALTQVTAFMADDATFAAWGAG